MKMKELLLLLERKGLKISAVESCTGGAFASALVNQDGASAITQCNLVAYSPEAKVRHAGVMNATIEQFGIVSEEVATEMAAGARALMGADIGVGVTGFAGPTGEPVGRVCFGINYCGEVFSSTQHFNGERAEVINQSVEYLTNRLIEIAKE
jgi:PncC family amidohydrolase